MIQKYLYGLYELPPSYHGAVYENTALIKVKQEDIYNKVANAPQKGLLVIQGNAGPVINQLLEAKRKVRGIDFLPRCADAFGTFDNPLANVVLIYNVGSEISVSSKVTALILKNILKSYANSSTLVILETHLTKSELQNNYHIDVVNFIKIQNKEESAWI